MAFAKHIIQRQVIELVIGKDIDRLAVQNKVSSIYRQQVVPLLDELLSRKSGSSTITIDRLELDLGSISINELEQVLAQKISTTLQVKLAQVIVPSETRLPLVTGSALLQQQENHTEAELLSHFLQTGLFPWWAQETTYSYLEGILKAALLRKDVRFKKTLFSLLRIEEIIKRLVYTFNDALLKQLVDWYAAVDFKKFFKQKEQLFAVFINRLPLQQLRVLWWMEVFQTVSSSENHSKKDLFEKAGWTFLKQAAQQTAWPALLQWCNRNEGKLGMLESITAFTHFDTKTQTDQPQQKAEEKTNERKISEGKEEAIPDTVNSSLKSVASEKGKFSNEDAPDRIEKQIEESEIRRIQQDEKVEVLPEAKPLQQVTDIDKLYIQNAGLVLLWPFLHRFFQQLELADDRKFLSKENAERASLLLQYLATGQAENIFEAQLPLNKMLCGIPLLQPIDTQWNITEKEIEEVENLLQSVIENAGPVWKNLSVAGLRQAYLARDGILSSRDGSWLLQVERKPYDILTDRLPWTVSIVKLPWMERLVFVEW